MAAIKCRIVLSQFLRHLSAATLALLITGCASKTPVPVKGMVLRPDGKPLKDCYIAFADFDQDRSGSGGVNEEGKFEIWTNSKTPGLPPGKYLVMLGYLKNNKDLPARYENFKESGWEVTVGRQGATDIVLRMTE